ncbi:aminotransferase class V-fold PLP-dependent enzyme [Jiulongibacter sediminis]|uniref:Aminotransferase class V domain-containing protein n=1 Tax=Jiulongibacter sediminis TaxID=1605367 RepID=A0A0P7BR56_9BACT|nr:aminotransferase class V-fold PLP-dependent enzyme [Jiulongibacter sediminis]KPM46701.1 hypothetical protein AFM12_18135 [Jiulongibacter sediminis]TBX21606.1 hypothetical protein TK44_18140 [Jiulongibacter sediminis]
MEFSRRDFVKGAMASGLLAKVSQTTANEVWKPTDDWEKVRKQFPLQSERIYLNNGTFGPSPTPVLEAIKASLTETNTSGEYGHTTEARKELAAFVGAKEEEISLTHNTTEGINIVCWGLPLKAGDEVVISLHEHVGNALPWLNRAKLHGIILKPIMPGKTADETLSNIEAAITPKTRVLALPHITCTTGQVFPLEGIVALAKKHNLFTAIDGAHGLGTINLDLPKLGVDFYSSSCHKWMLGPNGTGFLYIKEELLDTLQAYHVGAYSDSGWDMFASPPELSGYNPTAHRFDYASQSTPLYTGAAAAAQFHTEIGKAKIENRIRELNSYLFEGLKELGKFEILTPEEPKSRICMVSFKSRDKDYREIGRMLSKNKFRVRLVPESKLDAVRISTHIYNSFEEIDRLLKVLENV